MEHLVILEQRIKDLTKKRDWCIEQLEGFKHQLGTPSLNKNYWIINDFIQKRQEEAYFYEYEIKLLKKELDRRIL